MRSEKIINKKIKDKDEDNGVSPSNDRFYRDLKEVLLVPFERCSMQLRVSYPRNSIESHN